VGIWGEDSIMTTIYRFDYFDTTLNPKYIRIYQTIDNQTLVGGGDTLIRYGILQVHSFEGYVTVGEWTDNDVVLGLNKDSIESKTYYDHNMLRGDWGGVKILPPYNFDCQIPFSDIAYVVCFWGIGDPEYPNRVYRSDVDALSWNPINFTEIFELGNDELIAIEPAEEVGTTFGVYCFAHGSIWFMSQEGNYQAISTKVGAVSRETVVRDGSTIYFISPDMCIYSLLGGQLTDISQQIENWVESTFISFDFLGDYWDYHGRGMVFGDYVMWVNDSTGQILCYNTNDGGWTQRDYMQGNYIPRGSFVYDTLKTNQVKTYFESNFSLLYTDSVIPFKYQTSALYDLGTFGFDGIILAEYQTPQVQWSALNHNVEIAQIDIELNNLSTTLLRYTILDENGDSLFSDTIAPSVEGGQSISVQPGRHSAQRLSVKFFNLRDSVYIGGDDPFTVYYYNNFWLENITLWLKDMGAIDVL